MPLPPPDIVNKPHYPTPTNAHTPDLARHRSLLPLSSVEQVFLMLPSKCDEYISTTTYTTTAKNTSIPPPLNYIFVYPLRPYLHPIPMQVKAADNISLCKRKLRHIPITLHHPIFINIPTCAGYPSTKSSSTTHRCFNNPAPSTQN